MGIYGNSLKYINEYSSNKEVSKNIKEQGKIALLILKEELKALQSSSQYKKAIENYEKYNKLSDKEKQGDLTKQVFINTDEKINEYTVAISNLWMSQDLFLGAFDENNKQVGQSISDLYEKLVKKLKTNKKLTSLPNFKSISGGDDGEYPAIVVTFNL